MDEVDKLELFRESIAAFLKDVQLEMLEENKGFLGEFFWTDHIFLTNTKSSFDPDYRLLPLIRAHHKLRALFLCANLRLYILAYAVWVLNNQLYKTLQ